MQRAIAQWRASSLQKLRAATTVTTFTRDITSTADKADAGMDASATELAGMATELAGMAAAGADVVEYHGPRRKYDAMIARGELRQDAHQALTVDQLERVYQDLVANRRKLSSSGSGLTLVDASGTKERRSGWWGSIVGSLHDDAPSSRSSSQDTTRGLYMYGGPGCGKTMLMDMFAASLPRDMAKAMERIHFHDFMLEVHESLQEHRSTPDPLRKVARDIGAKSTQIGRAHV